MRSNAGIVVGASIALALVGSVSVAELPAALQPWAWSLCLFGAATYAVVLSPMILDRAGFAHTGLARVLALVCALALTGSGLAALLTPPASLYVMSTSVWTAAGVCLVAAILALEEHPREVLFGAVALPFLLFGYVVLTEAVMTAEPELAYGLIGLGLLAMAFAARPKAAPASRPAYPRPAPRLQHAH